MKKVCSTHKYRCTAAKTSAPICSWHFLGQQPAGSQPKGTAGTALAGVQRHIAASARPSQRPSSLRTEPPGSPVTLLRTSAFRKSAKLCSRMPAGTLGFGSSTPGKPMAHDCPRESVAHTFCASTLFCTTAACLLWARQREEREGKQAEAAIAFCASQLWRTLLLS